MDFAAHHTDQVDRLVIGAKLVGISDLQVLKPVEHGVGAAGSLLVI